MGLFIIFPQAISFYWVFHLPLMGNSPFIPLFQNLSLRQLGSGSKSRGWRRGGGGGEMWQILFSVLSHESKNKNKTPFSFLSLCLQITVWDSLGCVCVCVCVENWTLHGYLSAKMLWDNRKKAALDNLFGSQSHTTTRTVSQIRDDELLTIFFFGI